MITFSAAGPGTHWQSGSESEAESESESESPGWEPVMIELPGPARLPVPVAP